MAPAESGDCLFTHSNSDPCPRQALLSRLSQSACSHHQKNRPLRQLHAVLRRHLHLSLYPGLRDMVNETRPVFPGVKQVINYGIDKLRFPNAVKVGSRVRARCELVSIEEVKGGLQMVERFTAEIDGEERPACVADLVMRLYF